MGKSQYIYHIVFTLFWVLLTVAATVVHQPPNDIPLQFPLMFGCIVQATLHLSYIWDDLTQRGMLWFYSSIEEIFA